MSSTFLVVFAKFTESKNDITLEGVFFGGISPCFDEAKLIARECVNTIKGGTINSKVYELTDGMTVIDVMYEAADTYEKIVNMMIEANSTIGKYK